MTSDATNEMNQCLRFLIMTGVIAASIVMIPVSLGFFIDASVNSDSCICGANPVPVWRLPSYPYSRKTLMYIHSVKVSNLNVSCTMETTSKECCSTFRCNYYKTIKTCRDLELLIDQWRTAFILLACVWFSVGLVTVFMFTCPLCFKTKSEQR